MPQLTRNDLWSLEEYANRRAAFRAEVIAHKRLRTVHLGSNVTLLFEDEKTVRYQIQEMLRIERTFESAGIQDELDVYNPLIPDGCNLKATMLIEYPDPEERAQRLRKLRESSDRPGSGPTASESASRLPTRTSSGRTRKRHRRFTSCVSNSRPRCARRSRPGGARHGDRS